MAEKRKRRKNIGEKRKKKAEEKGYKILGKLGTGVTVVTIVAIVLILGLSTLGGLAIAGLQGQLSSLQTEQLLTGTGNVNIELSDLDQKICGINDGLSIPLEPVIMCTGEAPGICAPSSNDRIKILAFDSPSCSYSEAQMPILDEMKQKYGDKLEILYVCAAIHSGDSTKCEELEGNPYLPQETSQELVSQYSIAGTPTLVINCRYKRTGSFALKDIETERSDLDTLIGALLA